MINHTKPYSYISDPAVATFDDSGPRTVMDAKCGICARGARWIARCDTPVEFGIIPMQSELGAALLTHYGMDPTDPTSWLYLEDGVPYTSLNAFVRVGRRLGGINHIFRPLSWLPTKVQNWMYLLVARNRYRLSKSVDMCGLPDPELQKRLIQ